MDLSSPSTQKQIFPHWVKSSVLHGCSTFTLCEEQLPQSQPGLFSTFGPVAPNTPELATSEIGFHIRTAPFQFWPTETHFTSLCRKHKEKPWISPVMFTISATHQHHPYSFAAGLRVITMQCLAASLMDPHCETACADPGDKNPCSWWLCESLLGD